MKKEQKWTRTIKRKNYDDKDEEKIKNKELEIKRYKW